MGSLLQLFFRTKQFLGFHSISFPSEWGALTNVRFLADDRFVSIQLVSPASGEEPTLKWVTYFEREGFHSISFPSEWGVDAARSARPGAQRSKSFHSISFPSEWGEKSTSGAGTTRQEKFPFN